MPVDFELMLVALCGACITCNNGARIDRLPHGLGRLAQANVKTYIGILSVFAFTLAASWVYWYGVTLDPRLVVGTLVFTLLVLLGDILPIRVSGQSAIGVWDIALVVAVAALGPVWAMLVTLPSAFFVGRGDWLRTSYEISHSVILVYLTGIVLSFASAPLLLEPATPAAPAIYGVFAAGVTLLAVNKAISIVLLKIKYGQEARTIWKEAMEPYLLPDAVSVLTAALSVLALLVYGPVAAVVVIAGSIGSQVLVYRSRDQLQENRELRERVRSLEDSLTASNLAFGTMMISDLGQRDGYTHRHAAATATYAADIARELQLEEPRTERLRLAGLLHNIGMFGLPEELLRETGQPNSLARAEISFHPARGQQALSAVAEFQEMASWVRWHHERPDGRGYPDKLRGPWIPLESKILGVAQAYAALVLDQPRRAGVGPVRAREELSRGLETEFDGEVVKAFLRILDTESEGYRMADDGRFLFPEPGSQKLPQPEDAPRQDLNPPATR